MIDKRQFRAYFTWCITRTPTNPASDLEIRSCSALRAEKFERLLIKYWRANCRFRATQGFSPRVAAAFESNHWSHC
jgi:hypothetical protein